MSDAREKTKQHVMSTLLFLMTDKSIPQEAKSRAKLLNKHVSKLMDEKPWKLDDADDDSDNDDLLRQIEMLKLQNEMAAKQKEMADKARDRANVQAAEMRAQAIRLREAETLHVAEKAALVKQIAALQAQPKSSVEELQAAKLVQQMKALLGVAEPEANKAKPGRKGAKPEEKPSGTASGGTLRARILAVIDKQPGFWTGAEIAKRLGMGRINKERMQVYTMLRNMVGDGALTKNADKTYSAR